MTIEITAELLDDLLAKATAATPGPWQQCNGFDVFTEHGGRSAEGVEAAEDNGWQIADCNAGVTCTLKYETATLSPFEVQHNAAYIAAVNPDVVRALINEIKVLNEALDETIAQFDYHNNEERRKEVRQAMIRIARRELA